MKAEEESTQSISFRGLSLMAMRKLSGLVAGLDRLEPLLALPQFPAAAETPIPFGRYQIVAKLGAGRFGIVFLANDPQLHRQVVIKLPQPAILVDEASRSRFLREGQVTARLDHPSIVSLLDAGWEGDLPYLVSSFVDGTNLRDWRSAFPSPIDAYSAATFIQRLADALHHAHERGVLHCDVSPSNILIAFPKNSSRDNLSTGLPLIADFGMARIVDEESELTQSFQIAGTPRYMSPEQARGDRKNLTHHSDIYGLGVVFYELLVGQSPYEKHSRSSLLKAIDSIRPDPPNRRNSQLPKDINAICMKCIEKNPADRYASAALLAADMQRFLEGRPVTARPISSVARCARWSLRNPVQALAAMFVVTSIFGAIVFAGWHWSSAIEMKSLLVLQQASHQVESARAEVANDRARIAEHFLTLERVRQRRYDRPANWGASSLADLQSISNSVGDSEASLVRSEAVAALASVDFGPPQSLQLGFHGGCLTFGPKSGMLAIGAHSCAADGRGEIRLVDPFTDTMRRTLSFAADRSWESVAKPRRDGCWCITFSPKENQLLVGTRSGRILVWNLELDSDGPIGDWYHTPPDADAVRQVRAHVTQLLVDEQGEIWSGDGRTVAGWGTSLAGVEKERRRGELKVPTFGTRAVQFSGESARECVVHPFLPLEVVSPQSMLLQARSVTGEVLGSFLVPEQDRSDDNTITNFRLSPDGNLLASAAQHAQHLKLWDVAGRRLLAERITNTGTLCLAFHPNGKHVAVLEDDRVLSIPIVDHGVVRNVVSTSFPVGDVDVTPDGRFAVVQSVPPENGHRQETQVSDLNLGLGASPIAETTHAPRVAGNSWNCVGISPDGKEYAWHERDVYARRTTDGGEITTVPSVSATRNIRYSERGLLAIAATESTTMWPQGDLEVKRVAISGLNCCGWNNERYYAATYDGKLWEADIGDTPRFVRSFANTSFSCLDASGERLLLGTKRGDIWVRESESGEWSKRAAHNDIIWAITSSPSGEYATGGGDRIVKIWTRDGKLIMQLQHFRPIRRLFWSSDGRWLTVLAEDEMGIRRWDLGLIRDELLRIGIDPGFPNYSELAKGND